MLRSVGHTLILYAVVVIAVRILGKRQVGDMKPSELVVTILISEMAAIPMQDPEQPLLMGIIPIGVLLIFEMVLSFLFLKSRFIWRVFEGEGVILVERGKIDQKAMRRTRVTIAELLEMIRLQGFTDISQLRYAIFEANGVLSVVPYEAHKPTTPAVTQTRVAEPGLPQLLVSDGKIIRNKMEKLGLNEQWLQKQLAERKIKSVRDVFILTLDESGGIYCVVKDRARA